MRKSILYLTITTLFLMKLPLGSYAAEVTLLESPAAEASSLSRVFADRSGGVILSWVESDGKNDSLYFSTLSKNRFSKPQMIASGTDWFVNWADFPFVIKTDQSMTAHWLQKRDEGTYNYDVVAVFRNPETKKWSEPRIIHTDGVNSVYSLSEGSANQLRYNGITKAEAVTGGVDVTGDLTVSQDLTVTGTITGTITSSGAMNAGANNITTTGTVNAGVISLGTNGWTVQQDGSNNLMFAYNGTDKMKLDSSGNLTVVGNITAYGTV